MPILQYKSKDAKRIESIIKIYFCSTSQDREKYLDDISEDIWKIADISIYYDADVNDGDSESIWNAKLLSMNLFVCPITEAFFKDEKTLKELDMAIKNRVPVLPIFIEFGIEHVFNARYQNIHGLKKSSSEEKPEIHKLKKDAGDKSVKDYTKISYEEGLRRRIESITISKELYNQIEEEEEAYIFVSYRKKDVEEAKNFMKSIHEMDGADEIGLWYDNYLMPGENFEEAIHEHLVNCDAVGLVVTPSLLELNNENKENYVVEKEYPLAREVQKKILAKEMVETNRESLQKKLDGIEECIQSYDENLNNLLQEIKKDPAMQSKEHKYRIGMAYLKGINREINGAKAEKLIQEAANLKLMNAIKTLTQMYRDGEGVEVNLEKQIYWQRILVDRLFILYGPKKIQKKKGIDKENRLKLLLSLCEECKTLGELYEAVGKVEEALKLYEEALKYCQSTDKLTLEALREYMDLTFHFIDIEGKLCVDDKEVNRLIMRCKEAENIGRKLFAKSEQASDLRLLYFVKLQESILCEKKGDYGRAIVGYNAVIELFERLAIKDKEVGYRDLGRVRQHKVDALIKMGNIAEALQECKEAVKESEKWVEESKSDDAFTSLSSNYERLGDIYRDAYGEVGLEKSVEYLEKSIEISKSFTEDKSRDSLGRQLDLAAGYRRLGGTKEQQQKLDEAKELYTKALDIHQEQYKKFSESEEVKLRLAESYTEIGDIYYTQYKAASLEENSVDEKKSYDGAEWNYRSGYELANEVALTKHNAYRRQYITSRYYYRMGALYVYEKNDVDSAKEYMKKALNEVIVEQLKDEEEFQKTANEILSVLRNLE